MKKKVFHSLMILLGGIFIFTVTSYANSNNMYSGKYNAMVTGKVEEVNKNCTDTQMEIEKLQVFGNSIELEGSITLDETFPVKIRGTLYQSKLYKNSLFVKAVDDTGVFNVVDFHIVNNMPKESTILKQQGNQDILLLYLQRNGDKGLFMYEIPLDILNISLENITGGDLEDVVIAAEEHWWLSYFEPSNTYVVQPRGTESLTRIVTLYQGTSYRYEMELYLSIDATNYVGSNINTPAQVVNKLEVRRQETFYNGQSVGNGQVINLTNCVGRLIMQNNVGKNTDYFKSVAFGNNSSQVVGGFTLSTSLGVSFGALSGSISWTPQQVIKEADSLVTFPNQIDVNGVAIPFYKPLMNPGDHYSMSAMMYRNAPLQYPKKVTVEYSCEVGYGGNRKAVIVSATDTYS